MLMSYVKHINESALASIPPDSFRHLYMVVPEPPKLPYLAYHNGETWIRVLGVPINDQGDPIDTRSPGEKLTD